MNHQYDVGIVGGGLGGLCASILLAKAGHSVVLFEKNFYPFNKVCGEYISKESEPFLRSIGVPLDDWNLPQISNFGLTHHLGKRIDVKLPLGGIGVSRYFLDDKLADIALANGVVLLQGTEVLDITFSEKTENFNVLIKDGDFTFRTVLGAFGKRSKLDKKLKRPFVNQKKDAKNNFVGVKYHVESPIEDNKIELHLFEEGYAGISRVEGGKSCFCYLTTANLLQKSGGRIAEMEAKYLQKNPYLKEHFDTFSKINQEPVTISQIEFGPKEQVNNHVLLLGDAAGMITPLTGNGMSMAMHGAKMASEQASLFLQKKQSRLDMEKSFIKNWNNAFGSRVKRARKYQNLFFREKLVSNVMGVLKLAPSITKSIIKSTHGKAY